LYADLFRQRLDTITGFQKLVCGIGAGATAVLVGAPFDLLKTRMQSDALASPSFIVSEEGRFALFNGVRANLLRVSLGTCMFWF
jgi:hypothetical protein